MFYDDRKMNNRRRFVRVHYNGKAYVETYAVNNQVVTPVSPVSLLLIDISVGGVGAICQCELPVDAEFSIGIKSDFATTNAVVRVVYCTPERTHFKVGLEFVSPSKELLNTIKKIVLKNSAIREGVLPPLEGTV